MSKNTYIQFIKRIALFFFLFSFITGCSPYSDTANLPLVNKTPKEDKNTTLTPMNNQGEINSHPSVDSLIIALTDEAL
jgi:hypothetical protein